MDGHQDQSPLSKKVLKPRIGDFKGKKFPRDNATNVPESSERNDTYYSPFRNTIDKDETRSGGFESKKQNPQSQNQYPNEEFKKFNKPFYDNYSNSQQCNKNNIFHNPNTATNNYNNNKNVTNGNNSTRPYLPIPYHEQNKRISANMKNPTTPQSRGVQYSWDHIEPNYSEKDEKKGKFADPRLAKRNERLQKKKLGNDNQGESKTMPSTPIISIGPSLPLQNSSNYIPISDQRNRQRSLSSSTIPIINPQRKDSKSFERNQTKIVPIVASDKTLFITRRSLKKVISAIKVKNKDNKNPDLSRKTYSNDEKEDDSEDEAQDKSIDGELENLFDDPNKNKFDNHQKNVVDMIRESQEDDLANSSEAVYASNFVATYDYRSDSDDSDDSDVVELDVDPEIPFGNDSSTVDNQSYREFYSSTGKNKDDYLVNTSQQDINDKSETLIKIDSTKLPEEKSIIVPSKYQAGTFTAISLYPSVERPQSKLFVDNSSNYYSDNERTDNKVRSPLIGSKINFKHSFFKKKDEIVSESLNIQVKDMSNRIFDPKDQDEKQAEDDLISKDSKVEEDIFSKRSYSSDFDGIERDDIDDEGEVITPKRKRKAIFDKEDSEKSEEKKIVEDEEEGDLEKFIKRAETKMEKHRSFFEDDDFHKTKSKRKPRKVVTSTKFDKSSIIKPKKIQPSSTLQKSVKTRETAPVRIEPKRVANKVSSKLLAKDSIELKAGRKLPDDLSSHHTSLKSLLDSVRISGSANRDEEEDDKIIGKKVTAKRRKKTQPAKSNSMVAKRKISKSPAEKIKKLSPKRTIKRRRVYTNIINDDSNHGKVDESDSSSEESDEDDIPLVKRFTKSSKKKKINFYETSRSESESDIEFLGEVDINTTPDESR